MFLLLTDAPRPWMRRIALRVLKNISKELPTEECYTLACDHQGGWLCTNAHGKVIFESKKSCYLMSWFKRVSDFRAVSLTFNSKSIAYRHLKVVSNILECNIIHHYHGINQREYVFSWHGGWRRQLGEKSLAFWECALAWLSREAIESFLYIKINKIKFIRYFILRMRGGNITVEPNGDRVEIGEGLQVSDTIFFLPLFETLSDNLKTSSRDFFAVDKLIFVTSGAFYKPEDFRDASAEQLRILKRAQLLSRVSGLQFSIVIKESEYEYASVLKNKGLIEDFKTGIDFNDEGGLFIVPCDSTVNFECILSGAPCVSYNIFDSQALIGRYGASFGIMDFSEIESKSMDYISEYCRNIVNKMKGLGESLRTTSGLASANLARLCLDNSKNVLNI